MNEKHFCILWEKVIVSLLKAPGEEVKTDFQLKKHVLIPIFLSNIKNLKKTQGKEKQQTFMMTDDLDNFIIDGKVPFAAIFYPNLKIWENMNAVYQ